MSKEVKFNFYELEYDLIPNLMNFDLKNYFEKPLDIKKHLFSINNYKAFMHKYDEITYIFRKYKKDFLPKIGDEDGNMREIALEENEYIVEENALIMDLNNNLIIYQQNRAGFGVSAFEEYLRNLLKGKVSRLILKPIILGDTLEKLKQSPIIKEINFKVSRPNVKTLKQLGFSSEEIRRFIDIDSTNGIEVIIKSKRHQAVSNLEKIKDLIKNNIFDKFKVKASNSYEDNGDYIDILDNILSINRKIKVKDKRADILDLIPKLKEVYEEYISQIQK